MSKWGEGKRTPEQLRVVRERQREWRKQNVGKMKERSWRYRGLDLSYEKFLSMLDDQGGACAVCRKPINEKAFVDHDHESGEIRGLLCNNCNLGVGHFFDSTMLLREAADYLERYSRGEQREASGR